MEDFVIKVMLWTKTHIWQSIVIGVCFVLAFVTAVALPVAINNSKYTELKIGCFFDSDGTKGTKAADDGTKWYVKFELKKNQEYKLFCGNNTVYSVDVYSPNKRTKIFSELKLKGFIATTTGYYYAIIQKNKLSETKPSFFVGTLEQYNNFLNNGSNVDGFTIEWLV